MKENLKKSLVSIFIIVIMVSSVIGFIFSRSSGNSETVEYGEFSFQREEFQWNAEIKGEKYYFDYFPEQIEHLNVSDGLDMVDARQVDMTSDVEALFPEAVASAQYSLAKAMKKRSNTYTRIGFTENNTYDLPIIRCSSATENVPVIYFTDANKTQIKITDNCIIAEAEKAEDFVKIKDRLLYDILDII